MKIGTLAICLGLMVGLGMPAHAENPYGTFPHATDFLTLRDGPGGTIWYPRASPTERTIAIQELKNRGYTHLYLSVASESHNYYSDPLGFRALLEELYQNGIKPVVWLTSDTGTWKNQPVDAIKSDLTAFIPQIDDLVNSYCLGLEVEEYWDESEADEIGNHLDSLTSKPIAVHQLQGAWNYCHSFCDYLILQYGFGKTEAEIMDLTTQAKTQLGKPVVAGEYNLDRDDEALSIRLGDAALAAGATGFGNGGSTTDSEPDGMWDQWEVQHFTETVTADAVSDFDGDGLLDKDEFLCATDPKKKDSDGDGVADGLEVRAGMNPILADEYDSDGDQDGYSDLREIISGSSPSNPESLPATLADSDPEPDGDGDVDGRELAGLIVELGSVECPACQFDLDADGDVDVVDLFLFSEDFGRSAFLN